MDMSDFVPSTWKLANITAFNKQGAKIDPLNDRPFKEREREKEKEISLHPFISKTMEYINAVDIKYFLFFPTALSQVINSDSHLVTLSWTCCFYSPNNGWRPSISDVRSGAVFLEIS